MNSPQLLTRRRFLYRSIGMGAGFIVSGCVGSAKAAPLSRYEYEKPQMGVPFRLVFYARNPIQGDTAARAAWDRITFLNTRLSDYEEDSELTCLNRTAGSGRAIKVSPELWTVLWQAQRMARLSGGAFDITAGPYISLWRRARRIHRLPEPEKLAEARKAVGYQKLALNPQQRTATLLVPKMKLDLGGLAKGFAADQALKVLRQHGITRALVAASGDTIVGDPPPGERGWKVEIGRHPDAPPESKSRILLLRNMAVATSGDAFQSVVLEGKRYSHIVNPFTGLGLTDQSQVTIVAHPAMMADALATAVSVLGPSNGLALAQSLGAAMLYQRKSGERFEEFSSRKFSQFLLE